MSDNPIKDELDRRLGEILVPAGYTFEKLDNDVEGFVRRADGVRQMVFAALWDRTTAFEFAIGLGIRVEAVEAITKLFSGVLPEYQSSSDTCVINLKAILPQFDRFTVSDEATIGQAIDHLAPSIANYIFPFLDTHRDVASLDRLMNQSKTPQQVWGMEGWGTWMLWYALSAITLARLAKNPEFEKLVELYRHQIRDFDDDDRERYEKLVKHLRSLT